MGVNLSLRAKFTPPNRELRSGLPFGHHPIGYAVARPSLNIHRNGMGVGAMAAQQSATQTPRQAGWFSDPLDDGRIRYWDGSAWTHQTSARVDMPPPAGPAHPAPTRTPGPGVSPAAAGNAYADSMAASGSQRNGTPTPVPVYSANPGYDPALGYGDNYSATSPASPSSKTGRKRRGNSRRQSSGSVGLRANMFSTAAVLGGILAIVFMPLFVGVVAIASGALALIRGERRASAGLKVAIIGMVVGLVWAYVSMRFGIAI